VEFKIVVYIQGLPSPWGNDAFSPPVSDFPLFPKNFSDSAKNFPNLTFSPQKFRFSDDSFSVIHDKFRMSTPISLFQFMSPLFRQIFLFPLLLQNVRPWFCKIHVFRHILRVFRFPLYFYHDAFMHHTIHVLDALVNGPILKSTKRFRDCSSLDDSSLCSKRNSVFKKLCHKLFHKSSSYLHVSNVHFIYPASV